MSISAKDFCRVVKDGDTVVARLANRDDATGCAPDWSQPQTFKLYVQRRNKAYKNRGIIHPVGEICVLAIMNSGWAEYSEESWDADFAVFITEEWRMEILSLNGEDVIPSKSPINIQAEMSAMQNSIIKNLRGIR